MTLYPKFDFVLFDLSSKYHLEYGGDRSYKVDKG